MGKRARRLGDGTWETPRAEGVQEAAGTQLVNDLCREIEGNHGTVGGIKIDILIVCEGEGLQRGWS